MKNKQFVEYSDKERRFKIDQLLYLDVDSQSRAELIDLFGILSDNPMYRILSKMSTTLYLLGGIFVMLLLCFATLYVKWYVPGKSGAGGRTGRLLGTEVGPFEGMPWMEGRMATAGEGAKATTGLGPIGLGSGFDGADDVGYGSALDFPEQSGSANGSSPTNTTATPNATDPSNPPPVNQNPKDNTPISEGPTATPAPNPTATPTPKPTPSPAAPNTTLPKPKNDTKTVATDDDDEDDYVDVDLQNNQSSPSSNLFLYFLLAVIAVLALSLLVVECRKRQVYRNLLIFEETTLKTFHNKLNNRIIISSCHEQIVFLSFKPFSIYHFKFLVHNNGTESESLNMSGGLMGSMNSQTPLGQPLQAQLGSENSIIKTIDEEGEKYHNAVISLNKQLQSTN